MNEDFNISKDGEPIGKCLKKLRGEVEADNYYCSKCGTWYAGDFCSRLRERGARCKK